MFSRVWIISLDLSTSQRIISSTEIHIHSQGFLELRHEPWISVRDYASWFPYVNKYGHIIVTKCTKHVIHRHRYKVSDIPMSDITYFRHDFLKSLAIMI